MMISTFRVCLGIFIFNGFTVPCADALLQKYLPLISDVHEHYKTSSVCIIIPNRDKYSDESAYVLSRELSRMGILTLILHSEEMIKHTIKENKKEVPPLVVVPLKTADEINNIRRNTRYVNVSSSIWLVIFMDGYDDEICELCEKPTKNIFRVRFNTQMLVLCCKDPLLNEWWAIDDNSMKTLIIGKWTTRDGLKLRANESLYARRPRIDSTEFRVAIVTNSAFHIEEDGKIGGFFNAVLMELQRVMNFRITKVIREEGFGSWNSITRSWSGAIELINKGDVDIGVAEFSMTNHRLDVVDFTLPLMLSETQLYFKPLDASGVLWSAYFKAFSFQIWLTIIFLMIGSTLLITLMKMRSGLDSCPQLIVENYLNVWGIFCQQGLDVFPVETSLRIAYISIFASALVTSAAYSAALISFITVSSVNLPFSTLTEFANDGSYRLIVIQNSSDWDLFFSSTDPVLSKMKGQLKPWNKLPRNMQEGFDQVCTEKVAFFTSESMVETITDYFPCKVNQIDTGNIDTFAMILPVGSQYTGLINYHIQRFQDNGMINRLKNKYLKKPVEHEKTLNQVTVWGIAPILSVLAGGIIIAFVIFSCEKFHKTLPSLGKKCRAIDSKSRNNSQSAKFYRWLDDHEKQTALNQRLHSKNSKWRTECTKNLPTQYCP